jgi:hypothetical protein
MNSIESTVGNWSGVEVGSHDRGGGREFILDGREIGHVHGSQLVDIPFAKRLRDILIEEERAEKHHVVPDSGWISYRIRSDEDIDGALWLLRVAYLYHVITMRKSEEEPSEIAAVDIDAELAELGVSNELHDAFSDRRSAE